MSGGKEWRSFKGTNAQSILRLRSFAFETGTPSRERVEMCVCNQQSDHWL